MIELIIQLNDGTTAVHQLKDDIVTIGRDTDNVITIADGSVSRHHAEIKSHGGIYTLRDLDSANGTTLNDEPITERIPKDGDVVCFGLIRATWVAKPPPPPPPPAPIQPASVMEADRPSARKPHALVLGVVLLVALSAVAALVYHVRAREIAASYKHKGQVTKTLWDGIHQIEDVGNDQNKHMLFGEYPRLENGMFDFRWFDDKAFESFLERLDTRSKRGYQVVTQINHLDKTDVDADLLAYTTELCSQWTSASDLDLIYARYVSTLYKQHKEPERPPGPDDIQALQQQWMKKRTEHQARSTTVIAHEVSIGALLTGRYKMDFKL